MLEQKHSKGEKKGQRKRERTELTFVSARNSRKRPDDEKKGSMVQ